MTAPATGKEKLDRKLARSIEDAIELAHIGKRHVPAHAIAARIYDSEPDLVAEVQRQWVIERLTWMITRKRRERYRDGFGSQMVLPDPVFHGLPETVFLHNGKRPKLDNCRLPEIRDHLKLLRERFDHHPRVTQMEAVVELHRKWAATKPNITWGQAQRKEAEERAK